MDHRARVVLPLCNVDFGATKHEQWAWSLEFWKFELCDGDVELCTIWTLIICCAIVNSKL